MYYVGFCRICGSGPLGLRECGGCSAVVVLCDECDAVWSDADFTAKPKFADEGELPCPHCQTSLVESPSRWAQKTTLDDTAWLQAAVQSGHVEVKRGSALAPEVDSPEVDTPDL